MTTNDFASRETTKLMVRCIRSIAAGAVATVLATGVTFAQGSGDDEAVDEIIITGSRIPRSGFETLQPATVLDGEKLDLRGNISLAKSLNEQAGFVTPATSPASSQLSESVGQNFVDYLGLGQQRTLTLVNGQRFPAGVAPNGTGGLSVDLNAIPDNLIDRADRDDRDRWRTDLRLRCYCRYHQYYSQG